MTTTKTYLKKWKKALLIEIQHLKKYGSNKYRVINGRLLSKGESILYFFESTTMIRIPLGSTVRFQWGSFTVDGRILSAEEKNIILSVEQNLGDLISEANIIYDPWELLDQLIQRLDEVALNKQKRLRIKKLMDPSMPAKHPTKSFKSNVHEVLLRSKYNPVTFVWGPPGTGKTYTLARVVSNHYFKNKRVLVLAQSNQAVDVLMSEVYSFVDSRGRYREGDLLRYGSQMKENPFLNKPLSTAQLIEKRHPDLSDKKKNLLEERRLIKQDLSRSFSKRDSDQLLELETKLGNVLDKIRKREIQLVKDAEVIGTTLAKAASDPAIYEKEYDLVVLDEASMAYVPQIAFTATLGKRVIICGDFKQLPPIAAARHALVEEWLKEDIFHRAGVVSNIEEGNLHPHLFLLNEQRRMHPSISSFTNKYIYHSLVGDHSTVAKSRSHITGQSPFPNKASILIDTSHTGAHCIHERTTKSRINFWQLLLSFQLIHESYLSGARSIGYVTPYRAQAELMDLLLQDLYEKERIEAEISAATVHRFQGSERDVMIFDSVDSFPKNRAGMLLIGKDSERLLNVAITRTKGKFIHVNNTSFTRKYVYHSKTLRKLVEHQIKQEQTVLPGQIGTWIKNQHKHLHWMHARKIEGVMEDIKHARKSIIISLPQTQVLPSEWITVLNNRMERVELTLITSEKQTMIQPDRLLTNGVPFPFLLIDEQYLWLGLPIEATSMVKPPYVAVRLDSKSVCQYMITQLPTS